jgi:hypothetical protein
MDDIIRLRKVGFVWCIIKRRIQKLFKIRMVNYYCQQYEIFFSSTTVQRKPIVAFP